MASEQRMTLEQVAEVGRCRRLLPTESDFKGRKGYWQRPKLVPGENGQRVPDPSGAYEWGFKYQPNVRGKKTHAQREVEERMRPFSAADTERSLSRQAAHGRALLKDRDGTLHVVPPAQAETAAHNNGWSHHWRARGVRVESGREGMLFRCVGGAWEPTGRRCLGTPLWGPSRVPRRGIQHDPDGNPWRYVAGAWRKIGP